MLLKLKKSTTSPKDAALEIDKHLGGKLSFAELERLANCPIALPFERLNITSYKEITFDKDVDGIEIISYNTKENKLEIVAIDLSEGEVNKLAGYVDEELFKNKAFNKAVIITGSVNVSSNIRGVYLISIVDSKDVQRTPPGAH